MNEWSIELVNAGGIEPPAYAVSRRCSTAELSVQHRVSGNEAPETTGDAPGLPDRIQTLARPVDPSSTLRP